MIFSSFLSRYCETNYRHKRHWRPILDLLECWKNAISRSTLVIKLSSITYSMSLGPHTYSHIALWTKRVFRGTVLDLNRHLLKVKTIKSSFNCMTKLKYYSTISLMHLRYELNNCSINGSVQNGVISTTVHYYKVTRS